VKPKVSIIILNYNGRSRLGALLDECIISALNQTYGNVEVVFADNGSIDDSCEYVRARYGDRVRVVCLGRNYGFALGNNLASKFVSDDSEYLLFRLKSLVQIRILSYILMLIVVALILNFFSSLP